MLTTDIFKANYGKQIIFRYDKIVKAIEEDKSLTEFQKEIELLKAEIDRWVFCVNQNTDYLMIEIEAKKHKGRFYSSLLLNACQYYNKVTLNRCLAPLSSFLFILRDEVFFAMAAKLGHDPKKMSHIRIAGFIFLPKYIRDLPSFKQGAYYECFMDLPAEKIFDKIPEVSPEEKTMLTDSANE